MLLCESFPNEELYQHFGDIHETHALKVQSPHRVLLKVQKEVAKFLDPQSTPSLEHMSAEMISVNDGGNGFPDETGT